ncbi:hypothetical protein BC835DRAFT_332835 [Cytidiella melzeri]|nr:hypothetical protein BC835DRAFT_332835 [Cytidiella melzeri]
MLQPGGVCILASIFTKLSPTTLSSSLNSVNQSSYALMSSFEELSILKSTCMSCDWTILRHCSTSSWHSSEEASPTIWVGGAVLCEGSLVAAAAPAATVGLTASKDSFPRSARTSKTLRHWSAYCSATLGSTIRRAM